MMKNSACVAMAATINRNVSRPEGPVEVVMGDMKNRLSEDRRSKSIPLLSQYSRAAQVGNEILKWAFTMR